MRTSAPSWAKASATARPIPLVAAGDDCCLTLELARALVALLAIVRLRVHLGLQPRRLLLLGWLRGLRAFLARVLRHGDFLGDYRVRVAVFRVLPLTSAALSKSSC